MRLKALSNIKADGPTELKAGDVFEIGDVSAKALVANGAAVKTDEEATVYVPKIIGRATIKIGEKPMRKTKSKKS